MALIGINNPSPNNYKPANTFDRITAGLQVAGQLLNAGVNAYDVLGPKSNLQNAQAQLAQAQTRAANITPQVELFKAGARPTGLSGAIGSANHLSPAVAGGSMTDHPIASSMGNQVDAHQKALISDGALPVDKNLNVPSHLVVKDVGGMDWAFPSTQLIPTDVSKAELEAFIKSGYQTTSANEPHDGIYTLHYLNPSTGAPDTTGEYSLNLAYKLNPEAKSKIYDEADKRGKGFLDLGTVKPFISLQNAASTVSALGNAPPSRSNDLALIQQLIKAQNDGENARFNNENVEGVAKNVSPLTSQLIELYKHLYTNKTGMLPPDARQDLINTVQTQYGALRKQYDADYDNYMKQANQDGVQVRIPRLPVVQFNLPENSPANQNAKSLLKSFNQKRGAP